LQIVTAIADKPLLVSPDCLQLGTTSVHRLADIERIGWPVTAIFRDLTDDAVQKAAASYPGAVDKAAGTLALSFNSYIVETPGHLILIDAGIGNGKDRPDRPAWHRRNGDFLQRLGSLGFRPDDFDIVVNTHLHADHVGWNTIGHGTSWAPAFPNARYVVPRRELSHWQSLYTNDKHTLHGAYADSVQPIIDAGLYDPVDLPAEIVPGLWLEPAPGHTGGMAVVRLVTDGGQLVFLADVLHSPIQLATPDLTSNFCVDPAQARATRRGLLDACAGTETIVATYHFPPPVFGQIVKAGTGYRFAPVN
jgi:glyoxylase-like metal-dependent hydrolase (beta-lactamase superfamily II)